VLVRGYFVKNSIILKKLFILAPYEGIYCHRINSFHEQMTSAIRYRDTVGGIFGDILENLDRD
jgi:hypothetical protein